MNYLERFELALDPDFTKRLAAAVADFADEVYQESGDITTSIRKVLLAHAGPTVAEYRRFAQQLSLQLLALNPDMDATVSDAALKSAVEQIWTPYANLLEASGIIALQEVTI